MIRQQDRSRMNNWVAKITLILFSVWGASSVLAKDLPGATQTSYGVSASGAFQFQIPLVVPAGRNGIQPNLSLSFSSGGGNGSVGVGWGVSGLGAITRCGRTIATDGDKGGVLHDANDRFCLNGKRLRLVEGSTYGAAGTEYRTELDEISKIMAIGSGSANINDHDGDPSTAKGTAPTSWEVWRKDGSKLIFGGSTDSQFKVPGLSSIHAWKLTEMGDQNGNSYTVSYDSKSYRQPSSISYAGNHTVSLIYENRHDVRDRYLQGKKITHDQRVNYIEVKRGTTVLRKYDLVYEDEATSGTPPAYQKSKLSSVTEYGLQNTAMPSIDIVWETDDGGFVTNTPSSNPPEKMIHFDANEDNSEVTRGQWVDVNGDGEVDQVIAVKLPNGTVQLKTLIKTANGWVEQSAWKLNKPLRDYHFPTTNDSFLSKVVNQGQLVDVNGDGLVDVVYAYVRPSDTNLENSAVDVKETWLNNGNGFTPSAVEPPDHIYSYVDSALQVGVNSSGPRFQVKEVMRGRFVDINGDGYVDWLTAYTNVRQGFVEKKTTWLNNGATHGWNQSSGYKMPDVFGGTLRIDWVIRYGELIDLNGDGLLDWLKAHKDTQDANATLHAWLNTGSGWRQDDSYALQEHVYESNGGHNPPVTRGSFVDLNGDGLKDWVRSHNSYTYSHSDSDPTNALLSSSRAVRLNTGKGWTGVIADYQPDFVQYDHSRTGVAESDPWPVRVSGFYIDVNRDGLVDYVQSYKRPRNFDVHKNTWLNTGSGWVKDNSYNVDWLFFDYSGRGSAKIRFGDFVDIDSDGSPDWVQNRDGSTLSFRLNKIGKRNLISKISTTADVDVSPSFLPLTANDDLYQKGAFGSEGVEAVNVEAPIYVASSLTVTNAIGGNNTTSYQYSGAQAHKQGRGFLGFKTFTTINQASGLTQKTEYRQDYPFTGLVKESILRETAVSDTSKWLNKTVNHYLAKNLNGNKTRFPHLDTKTTYTRELNENGAAQFSWSEQTTTFDNYANLKTNVVKRGLNASSVLQTTTVTNDYYGAITSVTQSTGRWLVSRLKDVTSVTSEPGAANPSITRENSYEYKSNKFWLLDKSIRQPNAAIEEKLTTVYDYDAFGNIIKETLNYTDPDPTGAVTPVPVLKTRSNEVGYDSDDRLPISLKNTLGHQSIIAYHASCDQPETVTDINGLVTTYGYDNFCRQSSVTNAAQVQTTTVYDTSPSCTDCQISPTFSIETTREYEEPVTVFYSHYSQELLSTTKGMTVVEGGIAKTIKQKTQYDALGRVTQKTQPYFDGDTQYWTQQDYDKINRIEKTTLPYGAPSAAIEYAYSVEAGRQKRITTDTLSHTKTIFANALGQIVEVRDDDNSALEYDYNAQGNLVETKALGSAANRIVVEYDALGRRIKLTDPDLGISEFTYDALGQLRTQKDAKNQIIKMRYDDLGRLKERDVPDASNQVETSVWTYDIDVSDIPDPNAKVLGSISRIKRGGIDKFDEREFTYDELGRPQGQKTYIRGHGFVEALTYNATDGRLHSRSYPSDGTAGGYFAVAYEYNNGYLSKITGTDASNTFCVNHWEANEYDALGRVVEDTMGDFIKTTRSFDQGQGVLDNIQSIVTKGNIRTVQNIDYDYDNNNNLKQRDDLETSVTENFGYDNLDRLTSYDHSRNSDSVTVTYDELGNITSKSDVGAYRYLDPARPNRLSRVDKTFDPNVAPAALSKFTVDWEWNDNSVTQAQPDVQDSDYVYDANGNITKQGERHLYWTAFDKPHTMVRVDPVSSMQRGSIIGYNADFERNFKQESTFNALGAPVTSHDPNAPIQTTYYVGKDYEKIVEGGTTTHRYTVSTGGNSVQVERVEGGVKDEAKYILTDNLGSTNVILNALGDVEQRPEFDPWGMRMGEGAQVGIVNSITNKGYTGHEMDDEVGLVNMNARVYDAYLGRFMSADPVLPDPYDLRQFNRYSYVSNNPLKFVDPSGNCQAASSDPDSECYSPSTADVLGPSNPGFTICAGVTLGGANASVCNGSTGAVPYANGLIVTADDITRVLAEAGIYVQDDVGLALGFTDLRGMESAAATTAASTVAPPPAGEPTGGDGSSVSIDDAIDDAASGEPDGFIDRIGLYGTRTRARNIQKHRNCRTSASGCQDDFFSSEDAEAFQSMTIDAGTAGGGKLTISGARIIGRAVLSGTKGLGRTVDSLSVDEIVTINLRFSDGLARDGKDVSTVIANAFRREGRINQAASAIRDIAGNHLFNNGNKRTAFELVKSLNIPGLSSSRIRSVVGRAGRGELREVEDIARALLGD